MALRNTNVMRHNNPTTLGFSLPSVILGHLQLKLTKFNVCVDSRRGISTISCLAGTTVSDVNQFQMDKTTPSDSWSEFSTRVSGEWDGYGAEFTSEGQPIELPEAVVPEAYREWEVKVFDWQTQCPTLAQPHETTMLYKSIRLLPTVGCEADAATRHSINEMYIGGLNNKVSAFAYQPCGSYVAVWPANDKVIELEHCLIDPRDQKSRVRIFLIVRVEDGKMVLQNIRVFCEQWYGPYRNGDQFGGCALTGSAFASTAPLTSSEIVGHWRGQHGVAQFDSPPMKLVGQLSNDETVRDDSNLQLLPMQLTNDVTVRDDTNLVLLPRQLWCSLKERKDGVICSEVGWLFEQGRAVTSACIFSRDAQFKEISIALEILTPYV